MQELQSDFTWIISESVTRKNWRKLTVQKMCHRCGLVKWKEYYALTQWDRPEKQSNCKTNVKWQHAAQTTTQGKSINCMNKATRHQWKCKSCNQTLHICNQTLHISCYAKWLEAHKKHKTSLVRRTVAWPLTSNNTNRHKAKQHKKTQGQTSVLVMK